MADPLQQLQDIVNQVPVEHTNIGADEIMQLLNSSLEKGEPFASEFNKRVIVPLTDKINQKIYVSNIEVDGKQIGSYITDNLQQQTGSAIKNTSKNINKKLDGLPDSFNFKDSNLDLKSMLGIGDEKLSLLTSHKWNKLQRDIIERARRAVDNATFKLHVTDSTKKDTGSGNHYITLKDFLGMDRAYSSPALTWKWHGLQYDILKRAKEAVGKVDFSLTTIEEKDAEGATKKVHKIKLAEFMGFDKTHRSILATMSWNNLQRKIISKAKKAVDDVEFQLNYDATSLDEKRTKLKFIDLSSFMGLDKESSIWTKHKWNNLQREIIQKAKKAVDDVEFQLNWDEKRTKLKFIDLSSFIGTDKESSIWTKHRWNDLQRDIISKAKKAVDDVEFELSEVDTSISKDGTTKKTKKIDLSDFLNIKEQKPSFLTKHRWNDLQRTIIQKAKDAVGKTEFDFKQESTEPQTLGKTEFDFKQESTETQTQGRQFKSLLKEEPIVKVGAFEKLAIKQLQGIIGAEKIIPIREKQKIRGEDTGGLPSWVKWLAFSGLSLLGGGITLGVNALFDTGPFKGLKELISKRGAALGARISFYTGKLIVDHLASITGFLSKHFDKIGRLLGMPKGLHTPIISILGRISPALTKLSGTLFSKAVLTKIPVIGALFGLGFGISRIMEGDIKGGLLAVLSGVAGSTGIGIPLSLGIDAYLAARDYKSGGTKNHKNDKFNVNWREKLLPMIEKIPMISALIKLPKALGAFSTGDWKTGLKELAFIIPGLESLYNFFAETKEEQAESIAVSKPISIGKIIQDMFKKKIVNYYNNAQFWVQKIMKATMPDILKGEMDPNELEEAGSTASRAEAFARAEEYKKENEVKPKANDFIWRAGQQSQPFDSKDNIISVKDQGVFEELITYLKGDSKNKDAEKFIREFTRASSSQQSQMSKEFKKLIDVIKESFSQQSQSSGSLPMSQSNGTYTDSSDIRDPAYMLRGRVWERLR